MSGSSTETVDWPLNLTGVLADYSLDYTEDLLNIGIESWKEKNCLNETLTTDCTLKRIWPVPYIGNVFLNLQNLNSISIILLLILTIVTIVVIVKKALFWSSVYWDFIFLPTVDLFDFRFTYRNSPSPNSLFVNHRCQGVSKRCRLSWLTNSALVHDPQFGGGGRGGFARSQPMSTPVPK